jgi:hypothetical protein
MNPWEITCEYRLKVCFPLHHQTISQIIPTTTRAVGCRHSPRLRIQPRAQPHIVQCTTQPPVRLKHLLSLRRPNGLAPTLKLLLSPMEAGCATSPHTPAYHPTAHSFIRSQYKVEIVTLIIRKWITNPRKKIWRIGDAGILAEANNKGCNACMEDGDAGIWASAPARVQHPHLAQTLKILPSLNLQSTSSLGK